MMNFNIGKLSKVLAVDVETVKDAARLANYRIVGSWLCLSARQISLDFITEARHIQRMKDAATRRQRPAQAA